MQIQFFVVKYISPELYICSKQETDLLKWSIPNGILLNVYQNYDF